jgi:hypothetical protein
VSTKTLEYQTFCPVGSMKERRADLWLPSRAALLRREATGCKLAATGPPKWGFPLTPTGDPPYKDGEMFPVQPRRPSHRTMK